MARMSEDDEVAFDAFVGERRASLMRTAFLLTGDQHRAEDLVQAALLEVFRRWPRLRDRVDPVGYARKTVVTTHLNLVRRLSWREVPVATVPDDGAASDGHDGTVQRLALRSALLRLPPRMRAVLVLRYFDDLSEQDTAAALGCSQGTVKSSASRGLARLREVLDQHDLPEPAVVARPAPLPSPHATRRTTVTTEDLLRTELRAWADEVAPDSSRDLSAAGLADLRRRRLRHRAELLAAAAAVVAVLLGAQAGASPSPRRLGPVDGRAFHAGGRRPRPARPRAAGRRPGSDRRAGAAALDERLRAGRP